MFLATSTRRYLLTGRGSFAVAFHLTPKTSRSCSILKNKRIGYPTRKHYFSLEVSSATESQQATSNVLDDDDNDYDWDKILPFQKNSHNSIKIVVPSDEEETSSSDDDLFCNAETFHTKLEATIVTAEQLGKTAIWLTIPMSKARLIEEASKSGFVFHHAEGNTATLNKWLLQDVESRIPTYATHQIGVGAVVINTVKNEILCVREKRNNYRPWKIPGVSHS